MTPIPDVDNWWGLAAILLFFGVPGVFTWLTDKGKKGSDKQDTPVSELDINSALVRMMERRDKEREKDREKIARLQEEMAEIRPIATVKYPVALAHIGLFHQKFPASGLDIPPEIADDL